MKEDNPKLTAMQHYVTQESGTEPPFENEYCDFFEEGLYLDIVSKEVLFSSQHKFHSPCGWPAFSDSIEPSNIVEVEDHSLHVKRIEVRSLKGNSHLGHVFSDGPPPKGIRYCINSASLLFVPTKDLNKMGLGAYEDHFKPIKPLSSKNDLATLGAGCFWGVESLLSNLNGVTSTVSGYCGGDVVNPTYEDICTGRSGHAEVVQIQFDHTIISYSEILAYFFRLHDPTTLNSQGADIGTQYRSVIFYHSEKQKTDALEMISKLNSSQKYSSEITTDVTPIETFYTAEEYHQKYYEKKYQGGAGPICHYLREE